MSETKVVNWGSDFDIDAAGGHSPDQNMIISQFGGLHQAFHLHLFVVGTNGLIASAKGVTSPANATCWVVGRPYPNYDSKQDVLETIGHEIGHVLFGAGHPDEDDPFIRGKAPLVGTVRSKRLMCKGASFNSGSRLIVKSEWDEAEAWLQQAEVKLPMTP